MRPPHALCLLLENFLFSLFQLGFSNNFSNLNFKLICRFCFRIVAFQSFVCSVGRSKVAFSDMTLLVGRQQGHLACKKWGWWRWALLSPDGVAPSRMVGVSASVNLSLLHKVQKFSSVTGSPGWSRKKGHKMVVVGGGGRSKHDIHLLTALCQMPWFVFEHTCMDCYQQWPATDLQ